MTHSTNNADLIHLLKTIQYRLSPILDGAPPRYPEFSPYDGVRTPAEILNHIADVLFFTARQFEPDWTIDDAKTWPEVEQRFKKVMCELGDIFANTEVIDETRLRLIQGPLSDSLTHIGQMAMIRRMAGSPVPGENFFTANLPEVESD